MRIITILLAALVVFGVVGERSFDALSRTSGPFSLRAVVEASLDSARTMSGWVTTAAHAGSAPPEPSAATHSQQTAGDAGDGSEPVLVGCVALDDSDSNRVPNGDDPPSDPGPVLLRVEALKYIVAHLGTESGRSDRVGIVVFGGSGPDDLVTVPITVIDGPEARRFVGDAVDRSISSKRWTNYTRALSECLSILEQSGFGRAPSGDTSDFVPFIAFISDGRPEDDTPGASTEEQLQELKDVLLPELSSRGIRIFAVGYGAAGDPESPQAAIMRELARATDGAFLSARTREDLLPLADSILATLRGGSFERGNAVNVWQRTTVTVAVPLGAERVFIGVRRSSPVISIRLLDPEQRELKPGAPGVDGSSSATFVTWSLSRPAAGAWSVEATGDGTIEVDTSIVRRLLDAAATPSPTPSPTERLPTTPRATPRPTPEPAAETGLGAGISSTPTPSPTLTPPTPTPNPALLAGTGGGGDGFEWSTVRVVSLAVLGGLLALATAAVPVALVLCAGGPAGSIEVQGRFVDLKKAALKRRWWRRLLRWNRVQGHEIDDALRGLDWRFLRPRVEVKTNRRDVNINGLPLARGEWRLLPSGSVLSVGAAAATYKGVRPKGGRSGTASKTTKTKEATS